MILIEKMLPVSSAWPALCPDTESGKASESLGYMAGFLFRNQHIIKGTPIEVPVVYMTMP
ncbi:hypothetical protein GCM10009092_32300 [Bowmanella denitrificans]|uniref:Uncharacterized protein n=1 Tax=Bowmanella denitrificans TaxID=366582 RepID=A0ABN0XJ34_9ALTE